MSLNELIAQSGKFQAPDMIGQYAAAQDIQRGMQQNQMNQLNMTEKSRSLAEQEGLRNYLRSNPNLDTPEGLQGLNQYGGAGQLLLGSRVKQKQEMASAQKSAADAGKTEYETTRMKLTDSLKDAAGLTTPGAAITHIQNAVREGKIPQDKAEQLLATIPQDIEGFGKWRQQMMFNLLSAQNQLEQHFGSIDNGQTITQFSVPKYAPGATPNVIAQQQKQMTPGESATNARGIESNKTTRDRLNFEMNPEEQARVTGAKEGAKIQTKNTLDAQAALPAALQHVNEVNNIIGQMIGDANVDAKGKIIIPQGGAKPHKGFEVSVGASAQPGFQFVPGTDKANFYALKDQILSDAFLTAYKDSLKGGGAITEIEGEKGTRALLRARTSQSEPEFIKAMREFQQSNAKIAEIMRVKAGGGTPAAGNAPAPAPTSKIPPGWNLHQDAKGNKAYVSPDGKNFIEVK